jgi:serine protease Do
MARRTVAVWIRGLAAVALGAAVSLSAVRGEAAERTRRVAFLGFIHHASNLTPMRMDRSPHIAEVVQALKSDGLDVVPAGAGDQERRGAELALGGDVRELECLRSAEHLHCRVGVTWKLFEARTNKVLYTVTTRAVQYNVEVLRVGTVETTLLAAVVASLLSRPEFQKRFQAEELPAPTYPPASFKRCPASVLQLPRQAEEATRGTVLIEGSNARGSGFFISTDGLVLTAAHVVAYNGDLKVTLADGRSASAGVVRTHPKLDVALLRVADLVVPRCFEPARSLPSLGSEVYAIGSPFDARLAFSLSRGIVSGIRELFGTPLLQTDAPVNAGNSGGPLLGADGKALAVVSRKIDKQGIEGIGFGVPVPAALAALSLVEDAASSAELAVLLPSEGEPGPVTDADDPVPSLELLPGQPVSSPEARNLESLPDDTDRREPEQGTLPGHAAAMRWGGLALGAAGFVTAVASAVSYDKNESTRKEYQRLVVVNTLGWSATLLGGALFGWSFSVAPEPPNVNRRGRAPRALLAAEVSGRF